MRKFDDQQITRNVRRLTGYTALALVALGVAVGLATFLILTGLTPIRPDSNVTSALLMANAVLAVIMPASRPAPAVRPRCLRAIAL